MWRCKELPGFKKLKGRSAVLHGAALLHHSVSCGQLFTIRILDDHDIERIDGRNILLNHAGIEGRATAGIGPDVRELGVFVHLWGRALVQHIGLGNYYFM